MRKYRSKNTIIISDEQERINISFHERMLVKRAINKTLDFMGFTEHTEVSVTFVDDGKIKELNSRYRNRDSSTDVLSFPMEENEMLGDIVISTDHAVKQAYDYYHSLDREIAFLTVHSVLHLLGLDHERSEEEEEEMFGIQEKIMNALGLRR